MQAFRSRVSIYLVSASLLLSGCTATLVHDDVKRTTGLVGHCSGSEWVDDSSIAIVPVPVMAFVTPHVDLHPISSEPCLNRGGASTRVINREVSVNRTACLPGGLTSNLTLGVWQWCPARVTWSADVLTDMPRLSDVSLHDSHNQKS